MYFLKFLSNFIEKSLKRRVKNAIEQSPWCRPQSPWNENQISLMSSRRGSHVWTPLPRPIQQSSQGEHSNPSYCVPSYSRAKRDTLTQATLSHQAKVYTLTQAAAVQLRETLLPRLQCPTQQSSWGGHSNPGYNVPTYNQAKWGHPNPG